MRESLKCKDGNRCDPSQFVPGTDGKPSRHVVLATPILLALSFTFCIREHLNSLGRRRLPDARLSFWSSIFRTTPASGNAVDILFTLPGRAL